MTPQFLHFFYPYVFPTLQSKGALNKGEDSAATRRTGSEPSTSMSTSACTLQLVSRALSLPLLRPLCTAQREARQVSEPTSACAALLLFSRRRRSDVLGRV